MHDISIIRVSLTICCIHTVVYQLDAGHRVNADSISSIVLTDEIQLSVCISKMLSPGTRKGATKYTVRRDRQNGREKTYA
jgi:hypothetical protein